MDSYILQDIKNGVEAIGRCSVTRTVLELLAEAPFADSDAFIAALDALVAGKDWVTGYEISHATQSATIFGPAVPPSP
jgi:hypothetical protein